MYLNFGGIKDAYFPNNMDHRALEIMLPQHIFRIQCLTCSMVIKIHNELDRQFQFEFACFHILKILVVLTFWETNHGVTIHI